MNNRHERQMPTTDALARGLGWFSIGLGLAEVMAPKTLARTLGMEGQENLLRFYGARELAAGFGLLSSQNTAPWLWGRVGGDALDLATLARYADDSNPKRGNVALAIGAVAGVTALDVLCAQRQRAKTQQRRMEMRRIKFDYSDRSGFPRPAASMRGAASDFEVPRDMRTPEAMRPYTSAKGGSKVESEQSASSQTQSKASSTQSQTTPAF